MNDVFFIPQKIPSKKKHQQQIQEHLHKDIGNTSPICPYCNCSLPTFPKRKTKCKECKNFIFVVKRPYDSKYVLTTEKDKTVLEKDRYNLKHYFWQEDFFEYEKKMKESRKGGYTPPADVYWYKLQCQALVAFVNQDYQKLQQVYFMRGLELFERESYEDALKMFLQSSYIAACGPSSHGFIWKNEQEALKFGSQDVCFHMLNGGHRCVLKLGLSEQQVCDLFLNTTFEQLPYPIKKISLLPSIRKGYQDLMKAQSFNIASNF